MSKLTTPLLGLALAIWIIGWSWWFHKNYCSNSTTAATPALSISDGDFTATAPNTFSFGFSGHEASISAESASALQQLAAYLSNNPTRQLSLAGLFGSFESNNSGYDNLGIGRAETIKQKLVGFGVDSENILTNGIRVDNDIFQNEKMDGGVYFTFSEKLEYEEESFEEEPIEEVSFFEDYTIYYDFGKYKLDVNNQDAFDYLNNLRRFLKENPDRKVIITGHADSVGNSRANHKISEARARKVRRYLVDTGTKRAQIELQFKSDADPKDTNDTSEGREKNRRVELNIE